MIYLNNNSINSVILTLSEGSISGTNEYLFSLKNDETNNEFYFYSSATTTGDRYDQLNIILTGTNYTYFNSIPTQNKGFYYYKTYELYSGITSGITTTELSASTIDISTACTSNRIVEEGRVFISGSSLNAITSTYSAQTTYTTYK